MKKNILLILISLSITQSLLSQDFQHHSVHEEQSNYYKSLGFTQATRYDSLNGFELLQKRRKRKDCLLNKVVFGWHPYWSGSTYLNYEWSLLSDLSFFSYEVDANTGFPVTTHDWLTDAVVDSAMANGVNVNLCVTLFSDHSTFFASGAAKQNLIDTLISLISIRNAKGINIDFENVASSQSANLNNFVADLCDRTLHRYYI